MHVGDEVISRSYNTLSVAKNKVYFYGGYNGSTRFNDINMFDIESCVWKTINTQDNPSGI